MSIWALLIAMLTFAGVGAVTPGPVNLIAAYTGVQGGFRLAIPYVLGATISYCVVVLLAGLGIGQIFEWYPPLGHILSYLCAAYLLYLSYQIATSPIVSFADSPNTKVLASWQKGALTQWLNPKAWLVAMAGVSLFVTPYVPYGWYLMLFVSVSFVMCFLGISVWTVLGQTLKEFLTQARYQRWFNRMMALLLASTTLTLGCL